MGESFYQLEIRGGAGENSSRFFHQGEDWPETWEKALIFIKWKELVEGLDHTSLEMFENNWQKWDFSDVTVCVSVWWGIMNEIYHRNTVLVSQ